MKNSKIKQIICVVVSISLLIVAMGINNAFAVTTDNVIYSDELAVNVSAESETIVSVPIYIKNNTGIAGFGLNFTYDGAVLTPKEVVGASGSENVLTEGLLNDTISTSKTNTFKVIWSGVSDLTKDGTLFYINFVVDSKALGSTTIEVDFDANNTFDENIDDVQFNCEDIVININNTTYDSLPKLKLTANNVTAGEILTLNGVISDVDDLTSATFKVSFDSATFNYQSIVVDSTVGVTSVTENNGTLSFDLKNISSSVEDKILFSITFACSDTANAGEYAFECTAENIEGATSIMFNNCSVKVESSATSDSAVINSIPVVSGHHGKTMRVPVFVSNNKGLMGYKLRFNYDNTLLKPVSVTNSGLFAGTFNDNIGVYNSYFDVMWNSTQNVTANGQLFIIEFEVLNNTKTDTEITVSYSQADTFNEKYEDVTMICDDITVSLNSLLGDVNCDGVVNSADYSLLVSAVTLKAQLTDKQNAVADLNGDWATDALDALELDLYLNGYITEFSTFTLNAN